VTLDVPPTFGAALLRAAAQWPDQEAFVCDGIRLTFRDLADGARRTAAALLARGVRRGDHVAICMGNSATWLTLFYANALIGAVTVPVNTRFKPADLQYCLEQSDSVLLATVDRFLDKIDFVAMLREIEPAIDQTLPGAVLPRLRVVIVQGAVVPRGAIGYGAFQGQAATGCATVDRAAVARAAAEVRPDDAVLIQYTSGTTSFPKGALLSHANMLRDAAAVAARIGVRPGDRYFSARPFYHVAGTTLSILVALSAGACLLTTPSFDAGESLRIMAHERCTLVSGNDTMFLMMMNHPAFDRAKLVLRGGWGAAGPEVMRQMMSGMGARELCFAYGLSEASPNVVMSAHDEPAELRAAGLALPHDGIALRILGEDGRDQPADQPGEILVRGWNVMQGYYNMPEQTARAIDRDGWLHTGDLGALTPDGRLRFIGRLKDMFRVGGENVAPADIEEVLHAHPQVEHAQVIGVPDPRLGEVAAAYVRLTEGARAEPAALIAWCRERCANFKVPRYLKIVDSFETLGMTGSAKVQKTKLRAQALIDFGLAEPSLSPPGRGSG
jgi:fatty-acyl-CoA synthase